MTARNTLGLVLSLLLAAACTSPMYFRAKGNGGQAGTGGSGGTGGDPTFCEPGEARECYTGPEGTKGQGICKPGAEACNADGSAFGACEGETLPKSAEDCVMPIDEDCDGIAPACKGQHLWSKRYGQPKANIASSFSRANDLAVDSAGNVALAGSFNAFIDFGAGTMESAGGSDVFTAILNPDGGLLRASRFGGVDGQSGTTVKVSPDGHLIEGGVFSTSLDLGGGSLECAGATDLYLATFDMSGAHEWSRRFGDAAPQSLIVAAVAPAGDIAITGNFFASIDFGGGALISEGGNDGFIAKLTSQGVHLWSRRFGDSMFQQGLGIAIDAAGNVVATGVFSGSIDLGGEKLTNAGEKDIFIAKFSADGEHLWSKRFGDAALQQNAAIAIDGTGNIMIAGSFYGTIDLGGGPLVSAGEADVVLAKLDPNGEHVWSKRFGDTANQLGVAIAFDAHGNALIAGSFEGAADFGGGPLASAGGTDVFLAKLDPNGEHVWSKRFGDAAPQNVTAVTSDASGAVVVCGYFAGGIDFGGGLLVAESAMSDAFVAKFSP